jgi:RNA polymerase sigma-70 factor, ECF subfamily
MDDHQNLRALPMQAPPAADERRSSHDSLALRARARLQAAVARLPEPQRDALLLWRFEGLAYEEIATALGTSVQAAKVLLWRARESVRSAIVAPAGVGGLESALG